MFSGHFVIESVECAPLSAPLLDPFVIATGRVDATRSVLVTVSVRESDAVERGIGEGSCFPPVTREDQPDCVRELSRASSTLSGVSFADASDLNALLDSVLLEFPVARAGVELALLDAIARLRRVPVFTLISGRVDASPIETDITLPILPPGRMAELAAQWWARGFRVFKVKVGRRLEEDLHSLEMIAAAVPDARFRVDANGGYRLAEANAFLEGVSRLGVLLECFEQPCASDEQNAKLIGSTDVPVVADESVKTLADLERVRSLRAATGVNLKIAKSGGLLRAHEIGRAAQDAGMQLMVGGMVETRLGMTAASHLVAALGGVEFPDLDTAWLLKRDPFAGGYREDGPRYSLSSSPGFDVSLRSG